VSLGAAISGENVRVTRTVLLPAELNVSAEDTAVASVVDASATNALKTSRVIILHRR